MEKKGKNLFNDNNLIWVTNDKNAKTLWASRVKPKTVAKKPSKGELGIPDGFCPGEDGKSLIPCEEKVVKKPEPEIASIVAVTSTRSNSKSSAVTPVTYSLNKIS